MSMQKIRKSGKVKQRGKERRRKRSILKTLFQKSCLLSSLFGLKIAYNFVDGGYRSSA